MSVRIIIAVFFFASIYGKIAHGQASFKVGYSLADNGKVNEYLNDTDNNIFRNNYNLGIGYQYIFEGTGMSIIPGIMYTFSEFNIGIAELRLNRFSLEVPFKIFPFNMEGDCNCPDFSMRNKFFEKHFFLLVNSGINFSIKNNSLVDDSVIKDLSYTAGIGAGITIPIAKNILISPAFNYKRFFDDKWNKEYLFTIPEGEFKTSFSELEFEIRMVYKLN
jgi:hypothetical protein